MLFFTEHVRLFTAVESRLRRSGIAAVSAYRGVDSLTVVPTIAPTVASRFASNVAADPARPMLTWYDGGTGERTELSGATLANWVSKTSNLLFSELGLGPGDVATVELPPHWQTAAIMLGCWTAGLAVSAAGTGEVSFGLPGSGADYAVGLHPFALPVPDLPEGMQDWVLSARVHGDHYGGPAADPVAPAWGGFTHESLTVRALERAAEIGLSRADRALINVDSQDSVLDWLLAPIAVGASMVLCRNASAESIKRWAEAEKVTRQWPAVQTP